MQINNNYSNVNFKAFSKISKAILRHDVKKYQPQAQLEIERIIESEDLRKDRTIKISPYKRVSHEYVPMGFRTVTIKDSNTGLKTKTSISWNYPESLQDLLQEI